jgi:membrane-bound lytic murein transglycosylase A
MRIFALLSCLLLLSSCAYLPRQGEDKPSLRAVSFADLPGWSEDDVAAALEPLKKSCAVAMKRDDAAPFGAGGFAGTAGDWRAACENIPDQEHAREYFESSFTPYEVRGRDGPDGLFTGYYEPTLRGSYKRHAPYLVPVYARPYDLATADLGAFKAELKGQSVTGRVRHTKDGARFVPYYTRAEIGKGALKTQMKVVFVDSAIDAFYLQIQGSGLVRMDDGKILQVGYAAQNGRPYTAIGRELIRRGALTKDNVSMQSIRAWLEAHPKDAPNVMNANASYVFFRPLKGGQPLGAEGVPLAPGRSLAVDSKKMPYGAPLFLDAEDPDGGRIQRLMIAQDTGGAITGAVRGDFFWGAGKTAADKAGRMKSRGRYYILLPKTVIPPRAPFSLF